MKFEERKHEAKALLVKFLDAFATPRGMTEDQLATRIEQIADAFARRMPTKGDFAEACERVMNAVRDTHLSNSWPTQASFVMAMPSREAMRPAQETFLADEVEILSNRMRNGDAVPETAIWGQLSGQLAVGGALERYRSASVIAWREAYGPDAAALMRAKYGSVVDLYFAEGAA